MNMSIIMLLFWASALHMHPMHISFTNIEISASEKEATAACKFFADDFNLLFFHLYEKILNPEIGKDFNNEELKMINGYMSERLFFVMAEDTVRFKFVRKDQNEDSIWLYYHINYSKTHINKAMLINKLLLDLYMDQTNLVVISNGSNETGITYNFNNQQTEVNEFFK
jgi:hypothetical protein